MQRWTFLLPYALMPALAGPASLPFCATRSASGEPQAADDPLLKPHGPAGSEAGFSICICTFRRPNLLRQLLRALESADLDGLDCEIVIVDNDPAGSALPVIREWASRSPYPTVAVHVPTPSIALARNAAVHAARGKWVVFIDDDETPEPEWLWQLAATQHAERADIVIGPVLPRYPAGTPVWVRDCGVFEPHRYPTGTRLKSREAYSGNALIRRSLLLQLPGPFEPSFGVTGGEDTMLFWDLEQRGARIVWCAEARAHETVPPARLRLRWILLRSFRGGQSFVRAEVERLRGVQRVSRTATLFLGALVRLPVALGLSAVMLPFSRARAVRFLRAAFAQCGKITALVGHRYHEYATR